MGTAIRNTGLSIAIVLFMASYTAAYSHTIHFSPPPTEEDLLDPQYELLQNALEHYYAIQKAGGWQPVKATKKYYMKGQSDAAVKQIKKRLRTTGEFSSNDSSVVFTQELAEAVKTIQKRFGFKVNGVVDARLVKELNVPVEKRIQQLLANLERLQTATATTEGTRLVANIPEFKLYVYEEGELLFDMDIVVGSESNQTVIFNDEITHIVFSPYWNVPPSIVASEILPAMRKSLSYLSRNGYEQTGTENGLPVIRQRPGAKNSLGQVKFVFPNDHNIYLHDTPVKGLFALPKRTFSHGCIRLAKPAKLAQYLLQNLPQWTNEEIEEAMNSGKEQWVKLPQPVAVSLTYFTAWVDAEGLLQLREDVYGLDKIGADKVAKN
jgi:murein L,D-transpeptidase YcbB/YkuD